MSMVSAIACIKFVVSVEPTKKEHKHWLALMHEVLMWDLQTHLFIVTVASFLFMLLMLKEVIYLVVLIHGDCVNKHTCDKLFCMRFILVFLIQHSSNI